VDTARKAYRDWAKRPVGDRASYLARAVDIIRNRYGAEKSNTPLKQLITTEMGKPLAEADIEVFETADMLEFFATQGPALLEARPVQINTNLWPTKRSYVAVEPLGVVGVIKPWNYPFELPTGPSARPSSMVTLSFSRLPS